MFEWNESNSTPSASNTTSSIIGLIITVGGGLSMAGGGGLEFLHQPPELARGRDGIGAHPGAAYKRGRRLRCCNGHQRGVQLFRQMNRRNVGLILGFIDGDYDLARSVYGQRGFAQSGGARIFVASSNHNQRGLLS